MVSSLPLQVSIGLLFREVGLSHQQLKSSGDVQGGGEGGGGGGGGGGGEGFAAYFVVDSLDLDVLDFVEGTEDPLRRNEPTFVQQCPLPPPPATGIASNSKDKDENGDDDEVEECMQCKVEKGSTSGTDAGAGAIEAASAFRPIEFEIDTTFITIPQCLPALIYDPCDSDNYGHGSHRAFKIVDMMSIAGKKQQQERLGMPEASFRACFVVPDECLSSFAGRSNLVPLIRPNAQQQQQPRRQGLQGQGHRNSLFGTDAVMGGRSFRNSTWGSGTAAGIGGQIEDPDLRLIWVDLEVPSTGRGRHGQQDQQGQERDRGVKAQVLVRGSDLERVFVVRQALERRIHALF
ncbi:hypothetical protein BGZ97_012168 [Linnemannia gamsii]|uniref:Uncharacterized protein n=1 Tax=Linnemannia gamsii TaxID=64522 RepID=A0A9P6ULW5_9FUNG|nr:hypothetical protein BGZ97_012168 [Linnemannia gamsii]